MGMRITMVTLTTTDTARWVAGLLQTTDSFYPTGAYAHSYGLEGLVQAGIVHDRASLRTFLLDSVLPPLARGDLPVAARAWAAAGDPPDWEQFARAVFSRLGIARSPRIAGCLTCHRPSAA